MDVKWASVGILVMVVATLSHDFCKFSATHKLTQVTCSNHHATLGWESYIPTHKMEKLIFKNITGPLDLSNFTMDSLRYLVVSHSRIDTFSLGHFPQLVFLTILKNQKFPDLTTDVFAPSTQINWLSLVSNNHTLTPDAFQALRNLTWLHIQNQKLEHLTGEFFKNNTKLHELSIRNCDLETIDADVFDKTTDLEILSVNFNKLRHFENGTFKNLTKLKILELHHNKFVDFDLVQFRGLESLEVLGLPSGFLKSVTAHQLLAHFPSLQKMEVKKDVKRGNKLIGELRIRGVDIIGTPHDCHINGCNPF